ncbi:MAG: hypothetical protein ACKVW3_17515 [Phycisphaerales bacterium]
MTPPTTFILVGAFVLMDLIIASLVIRAVMNASVVPLARRFPPRPVLERHVRREFQSFKFGLMSLGGCLHVTADSQHLHLAPAWFARRFGMTPMSIPWDAIELRRVRRSTATVRINAMPGLNVLGPRWCLEIARPPDETATGDTPQDASTADA